MKKAVLASFLAAVTCIYFMFNSAEFMLSPGKLSEGHRGNCGTCMDCHTGFKGTPNTKCDICHDPEKIGFAKAGGEDSIDASRSLAKFHAKIKEKKCTDCHKLHLQSSGTPAKRTFAHGTLSTKVREDCMICHERPEDEVHKYIQEKCARCHNETEWKPAEFSHKMLVDNPSCKRCHEAPKDKLHRKISGNCEACHNFVAWRPALFKHRELLSQKKCSHCHKRPDGNLHKIVSNFCGDCHATGAWKPAEFDHDNISEKNLCVNCHKSPDDAIHDKTDIHCNQCHSNVKWKPARFDHNDYFRFDKHHKNDCAECHMGISYKTYTCYGCHEHSEKKMREEHHEHGLYDFQNCAECHRSGDEHEAKKKWQRRIKRSRDLNPKIRAKPDGEKKKNRKYHDDEDEDEDDEDDEDDD